jgi:hypothetical protein
VNAVCRLSASTTGAAMVRELSPLVQARSNRSTSPSQNSHTSQPRGRTFARVTHALNRSLLEGAQAALAFTALTRGETNEVVRLLVWAAMCGHAKRRVTLELDETGLERFADEYRVELGLASRD